jgi:large subunit ribosomal protein L3
VKFLLGKKIGMSQIFGKEGETIPVTLIEAGPCYVTQIKKNDKDGYSAVQVGFIKKTRKIKKTEKGKEFKCLREARIQEEDLKDLEKGKEVNLDVFQEGDKINISGKSKGKGFQGGVKKWGFAGRNATHGVKHEHRTLGSVGSAFPERVIKGRKMPGRMGFKRVTVKNLEVIKTDKENNILAVRGAVPGARGTLLEIKGE